MGNSRKAKDPVSDWTALLSEVREASIEAPGPEWKTCRQIAEEQNLSLSYMSNKLRELARAGRVEVRKFVVSTHAKTYPVPHYKIKK